MVFFVSEDGLLFMFEFPKPIHFIRNDGVSLLCGSISVEEKGMFAFKEGGWGNCIGENNDNNRHDLHHKCLYEIEYQQIQSHLSEKQQAFIAKLYKSKKFVWAGERTYLNEKGEIWVLCGMKKHSYLMRGDRGNYILVHGKDFHHYTKVELI